MTSSIDDIAGSDAFKIMEAWLAHHPEPDAKNFFAGRRPLSAREIVEEAKQRTPTGMEHLGFFQNNYVDSGCKSPEEYIEKYIIKK